VTYTHEFADIVQDLRNQIRNARVAV
jgi:hypothetical protein